MQRRRLAQMALQQPVGPFQPAQGVACQALGAGAIRRFKPVQRTRGDHVGHQPSFAHHLIQQVNSAAAG